MLYIYNLYNVVHQLYLNKNILKRVNIYTYSAYIKYIMGNAGLDEAQTGIKIAGRNINNLGYADDTTLWQKMKN